MGTEAIAAITTPTAWDGVVVAVNRTEVSEHALAAARLVARRAQVPVVLTSVTRGGQPSSLDEQYHEALAARLGDVPHRSVIVDTPGRIDEALRRMSGHSLLVIGMDSGGFFSTALGSGVSEAVLRNSHSLTMIVGPDAEIPPGADRLIICLDGTDIAEVMLEDALSLCEPLHLHPHLVQVASMEEVPPEMRSDVDESGYVRSVARRLSDRGVVATWDVRPGNVVDNISALSDDPVVAGIALVTHGRGLLGRLRHGSVTHGLIAASKRPLFVKAHHDDIEAAGGEHR